MACMMRAGSHTPGECMGSVSNTSALTFGVRKARFATSRTSRTSMWARRFHHRARSCRSFCCWTSVSACFLALELEHGSGKIRISVAPSFRPVAPSTCHLICAVVQQVGVVSSIVRAEGQHQWAFACRLEWTPRSARQTKACSLLMVWLLHVAAGQVKERRKAPLSRGLSCPNLLSPMCVHSSCVQLCPLHSFHCVQFVELNVCLQPIKLLCTYGLAQLPLRALMHHPLSSGCVEQRSLVAMRCGDGACFQQCFRINSAGHDGCRTLVTVAVNCCVFVQWLGVRSSKASVEQSCVCCHDSRY